MAACSANLDGTVQFWRAGWEIRKDGREEISREKKGEKKTERKK
jgi:hypothetical protein